MAQQRLSGQPTPSSPTSCTWGPSGWPCLLCLPSSSLLVLSRQPFLSCPYPPEASIYRVANSVGLTLVTGRHALPCPDHPQKPRRAFGSSQQAVWVTYAGSSPYVQISFCAEKSPFCPYVFWLPSAPQSPQWGNTPGLGFGIDCLWLQPKAAHLALGSHGWEHPEASVYPTAVLDTERPSLRSCVGSRSSWSSLPSCPLPAIVPASG